MISELPRDIPHAPVLPPLTLVLREVARVSVTEGFCLLLQGVSGREKNSPHLQGHYGRGSGGKPALKHKYDFRTPSRLPPASRTARICKGIMGVGIAVLPSLSFRAQPRNLGAQRRSKREISPLASLGRNDRVRGERSVP